MNQAHDGMIWDLKWHPLGHILCSASNDHTTYYLSLFFVAYFCNPVSRRMVFSAKYSKLEEVLGSPSEFHLK